MSDLIRREDVFKAIIGLTTYKTVDDIEILCEASVADSEGWLGGIRDALREVEYIPSAEPERKTGKWIDEKINSYTSRTYCSECGSSAPFVYESDDYYGNHAHGETAKTNFCPNCGADMRL